MVINKNRSITAMIVGLSTFAFGVGAHAGVAALAEAISPPDYMSEKSHPANLAEPAQNIVTEGPNAGVVVSSSDSDESEEAAENYFDPTGGYYTDSVILPAKFENVSNMEVVTRDWDNDRDEFPNGVPIAPQGSLYAGKTFKFKKIAIFNREIAFTTETVSGISYRFSGTFPNVEFCETSENEDRPDLKGTLIMIKDGKWFGETEVKFYSEGCGC